MSVSGTDSVAPPVRTETGSLLASDVAPNGNSSGLDSTIYDLLDGEPLESLLHDDAEDWGDDAALYSALFAGAPLADEPRVGNSVPPPPPAQSAETALH